MSMQLADVAAVGQQVVQEVEKAVVGKRSLLQKIMAAVLAGGHVLLEDYPGLAKTLIAKSFATALGLHFKRIQFTPDLLPSDITGSYIFDRNQSRFELRPGPIFANIILADEINRASPKTQSALLEAMQERQVTLEGETRPLPQPFLVMATQNPIEYEGTYPLPEAQLDRFLFKVLTPYGTLDNDIEVLRRYHHGFDAHDLAAAGLQVTLPAADIVAARQAINQVVVEDGILAYIAQVAAASRQSPDLTLGASTRAATHVLLASKTYAAMQGRDYVTPDDVKYVTLPVYRHRILLKPEAEIEGLNPDAVVRRLLRQVEVPR